MEVYCYYVKTADTVPAVSAQTVSKMVAVDVAESCRKGCRKTVLGDSTVFLNE